jgi:thymidylate synthase (FAD)
MSFPEITSKKYPLTVRLVDWPIVPERLIAFTYLECIEDRKLEGLIDIDSVEAKRITEWVLKGGHTPSLESVHLTFVIRNISRVLSHQIVRHRVGVSIGQRTQRAKCEKYLGNFFDGGHYVLPPSLQEQEYDEIYPLLAKSQEVYNKLIALGISQDEARYIMPQCATTSMTLTIAYKSLMHICSTRLCSLMQGEMVELAKALKSATTIWNRNLGLWLKPICMITGKCNRNENNPNKEYPRGVCKLTKNGTIPLRVKDDTFDLTKYSKDNS